MNPNTTKYTLGFPRLRGDEPKATGAPGPTFEFSPPTRG